MNRLHSGLTVTVAVKNGHSAALRAILRKNNESPQNQVAQGYQGSIIPEPLANPANQLMPANGKIIPGSFGLCNFQNSESTLFVTGVVLPAQDYCGETLPETLIFATTYWGRHSDHFRDLVATNRPGLCQIFQHCVDFPDGTLVSDDQLIAYIKSHAKKGAFNSRYTGFTKAEVTQEKELRKNIEDYLDKIQATPDPGSQPPGQDASVIRYLVQRHVKAQVDQFRWIRESTRDSPHEFLVKHRVKIVSAITILAGLIIFTVNDPASVGWKYSLLLAIGIGLAITFTRTIWKPVLMQLLVYPLLNLIASKPHLTAARPPDKKVRAGAASQLAPIINEMTAASPLKSGWLRKHFYALALRLADFGRRHLMNVPTVSTLRWLSIDKKRRLLFLSYYTGTTDFYVREFLTGDTPRGVNFMFTNGSGFPDAKHLTEGGISLDPEGYMNVIHQHQHVTDLWYAHDRDITIDQILRNRKIRNGLFKKMDEEQAKRWLKLF